MARLIRTDRMVEAMRGKVIDLDGRRVLLSQMEGSGQQADITAPTNAAGLGRVRHFRRTVAVGWPDNPLPIAPACRWLGIETPPLVMRAQVFQLSACAWRCWYCFVPFNMLSADATRAEWRTAREMLALYLDEPDRPPILDLSGGSPDLAPEWIAWTMDAVEEAGMKNDLYLWSDDNLSSDRLLAGDRQILSRMERYGPGYAKVCCLKGFDPVSFSFNTGAHPSGFEGQLRILEGYAKSDLDLFLYVTLTSPPRIEDAELVREFVRRLSSIRGDLPARTVPLHVSEFGSMRHRIDAVRSRALENQWHLLALWQDCVSSPDRDHLA